MAQQVLEIKNRILSYVKRYGPVLPVKISKEIGSNTIFAGAILSQLISEKQILITNGKVGGSPLYYVSGQEEKLDILAEYMNEKENKAFFMLKQNKVLRDKILEPWQRVALRELKDFAVMLKVIDDNKNEEIFWKWHLIPDDEAELSIKGIVGYEEQIKDEVVEKKPAEVLEKSKVEEIKQEKAKTVIEQKTLIEEKSITQKAPKIQIKEKKLEKKKQDNFKDVLSNYLTKRNINLIEENIVKNNGEYDLICNVPSGVGEIRFFVKVKNKRKVSDNDFLLAHSQARLKGLPLLYLSNGELSKKGKEYSEKNNLVFESI